jgi:hypothetical protein
MDDSRADGSGNVDGTHLRSRRILAGDRSSELLHGALVVQGETGEPMRLTAAAAATTAGATWATRGR